MRAQQCPSRLRRELGARCQAFAVMKYKKVKIADGFWRSQRRGETMGTAEWVISAGGMLAKMAISWLFA